MEKCEIEYGEVLNFPVARNPPSLNDFTFIHLGLTLVKIELAFLRLLAVVTDQPQVQVLECEWVWELS